MKHKLPLSIIFLAFPLSSLFAQSKGSMTDIQFIAGHWETTKNGQQIEAFWTEPASANMAGVIRMMDDEAPTLYEIFAIEMNDNGLEIRVKHFKPGLIGLEEKDKFDYYTFIESGDLYALFQKEGEDVRIRYDKRPGQKFAIMIGQPVDGKWQYNDFWVFSKKK